MAFFFLLHTPGPADLELRGKVGRTQTGSFWRLPIGRRAVRVRRSGGVVRERGSGRGIAGLAGAIPFFVCQLVLASFLLTATALNAAAQEAPKIEQAKDKPGQLKLPDDLMVDTGKAGKKLRPPACDKCKDEWDALRAALAAYYAAQSVEGYQNSSKGQNFKDQEKAGNSGMKDILGMSDKEMTAARKDYNTAKKDSKKQNSVKPDALLKAINDALAALRKCEDEKCPKPEKPVEKKDEKKDDEKPVVTHWPGFDELPGNNESEDDIKKTVDWFKGIKLPNVCSDEKTKKELEQLAKDVEVAEGYISSALKFDKLTKAAKQALEDVVQPIKDKIKELLSKCKVGGGVKEGPKSIKFIFRSFGYYSRPGGNTYNVTFSGDSTQQCTFADGAGVPAPIEFADGNGNPLETYFDPKTGESSDFGPDETPPPGWMKVIPTSDPKPKPGIWNLGNQPELWVDPQTGRTKWVEVGSDYKPVDPPQGWVELVPRSKPSSQTAEAPPTRTTETPPRTPTPETPRTPTTTETPQTPTTTEAPPRTPDTPPARTTDAPPTTPTSDDIPSTVFVKANEEVLQGTPTGQPLASQTVKLLAERPALPSSREIKTAQDTGFDKPPAQCTTGADGRCKFEVPADERPVYGLPVADTAARRPNYRVEFNALKSSGGVAEITGRKPATESAPADGNLASDIFNIGNRIFQRFGFNTPYESREDVEASYRSAFGDKYQVDTCETKKLPGLPLGIEPSSFHEPNHELSQTTIKLGRTARYGRASR